MKSPRWGAKDKEAAQDSRSLPMAILVPHQGPIPSLETHGHTGSTPIDEDGCGVTRSAKLARYSRVDESQ